MSKLIHRLSDFSTALEVSACIAWVQFVFLIAPRCQVSRLVIAGVKVPKCAFEDAARSARVVHITEAVAMRWPTRLTCLQRSLVQVWMLRRRNLRCELKIGVRRADGALEAHAWIETQEGAPESPSEVMATFVALETIAFPDERVRQGLIS